MNTKDIVNNKHYFTIIIVYGVILGIVYGYWMYREDLPIWSFILVGFGFLALAVLIAFIYVSVEARKANKQKDIEAEVKEEIEENEVI